MQFGGLYDSDSTVFISNNHNVISHSRAHIYFLDFTAKQVSKNHATWNNPTVLKEIGQFCAGCIFCFY